MQGNSDYRLQDLLDKIPLANRLIFLLALTTWIFDFTSFTSSNLTNNNQTLSSLQLWRILTSSFCVTTLFMLMIVTINFYTFLPKLEFKTASLYVLVNFVGLGAIVQLVFAFVMWVLPDGLRPYVANGDISGIWFNFMFKYCFFNTNTKIKFCCFPVKLSKLAYPFAFLGFLALWNFNIKLDALIGILIAFIECKFFNAKIIPLSSDLFCGFMTRFKSWIPAGATIENPFYGLE